MTQASRGAAFFLLFVGRGEATALGPSAEVGRPPGGRVAGRKGERLGVPAGHSHPLARGVPGRKRQPERCRRVAPQRS